MTSIARTAAAAAVLFCLNGCGSGDPLSRGLTVPVKGKVLYKGKPLTRGSIVFEPTDSGREAHGEIDAEGGFVLTTFQEGDGAVPGVHRVGVAAARVGKSAVPAKYKSLSSSRTEVEISADRSEYLVDLK